MNRPYSAEFYPPMPIMQVRFGLAESGLYTEEMVGIVDTGADSTIVPLELLDAIEAAIEIQMPVRGQWGATHLVNLYAVEAIVEGLVLPGILVIGDDQGHEVVLGRNVLNRLRLILDGLKLQTEIEGY
jgi:predicted aspartyl protease